MTLEQLAQLKLEADTTTTHINESMNQLVDQLKDGVPLSVGKTIINDIWGSGVDATRLIAKLSSSFPDENSGVIRNARLPNEIVRAAYSFNDKSAIFMEGAFAYIKETIPKIVDVFSRYSPDDIIGAEVAKTFRRESLRFIEAVRYGDFETWNVEDMTKWGDFQSTYFSNGVADGDYMFITDFVPEMEKIGKEAVAEREQELTDDGWPTMGNIRFEALRELLTMKLTFMYCEYLDSLLTMEE